MNLVAGEVVIIYSANFLFKDFHMVYCIPSRLHTSVTCLNFSYVHMRQYTDICYLCTHNFVHTCTSLLYVVCIQLVLEVT